MRDLRTGLRSGSIAAVCTLIAPLTSCGGSGSTVAPKIANCDISASSTTRTGASTTRIAATTTRGVRNVLTDDPAWQPDDGTSTNETYSDSSSPTRDADYYDSDLSGAPLHASGNYGGRNYRANCAQPLSDQRKTSSYGGISYTCWYQARISGVHNVYDDYFLGCTVDIIGGFNNTPSNNNNAGGGHRGGPVDGAQCSGSPMAVGDTISILNSPDTGIADINAMWNGNKVSGWMYKGDNGTRFVELNHANQAGISLGVAWGWFTAGVSTPGGYSAITKWNGQLQPGTRLKKCFTGGSLFA